MRTIKFRALTGNNNWVYGHYFNDPVHDAHTIISKDGVFYTVNPETVNQFTGLLDKNDKEIYEGDILTAIEGEKAKPETEYQIQDIVRWQKGGFRVFSRDMSDCYTTEENRIKNWMWHIPEHLNIRERYKQINNIEVIGNIYENPKLLE